MRNGFYGSPGQLLGQWRETEAIAKHDLTDVQWAALIAAWGGCAYCGADHGRLQKDCMLPISRGGRHVMLT